MQPEEIVQGRYRVQRLLGRGGAGSVWLAQDEVLHRHVALKAVHEELVEDPSLIQRVVREARLVAALRHPGIVQIHDILLGDRAPVLVMEFIDGPSLAGLLRGRGPLSARDTAGVGAVVAAALAATHEAGVVHRDVKPANILMEHSERALLTDFGIALAEGAERFTATGSFSGTVAYVAPEVIHGSDPAPGSDVWALGATLYQCLTGRVPFSATGGAAATFHRVLNTELDLSPVPAPLREVLRRLLEKDPARRADALEASRLLDDAQRTTPASGWYASSATTAFSRTPDAARPGTEPLANPGAGAAHPGRASREAPPPAVEPPRAAPASTPPTTPPIPRGGHGKLLAASLAALLLGGGGTAAALLLTREEPAPSSQSTSTSETETPGGTTSTSSTGESESRETSETPTSSETSPPTEPSPTSSEDAATSTPSETATGPSSADPPRPAADAPITETEMRQTATTFFDLGLTDRPRAWTMLSPGYQQSIGGYSAYDATWRQIDTYTSTMTYSAPGRMKISNHYVRKDGSTFDTTRDYVFARRDDGTMYILDAVKTQDTRG